MQFKKSNQSLPEFLPKPGMKGKAWSSPKSGAELAFETSEVSTDSSISMLKELFPLLSELIWTACAGNVPVKIVVEKIKAAAIKEEKEVNILFSIKRFWMNLI